MKYSIWGEIAEILSGSGKDVGNEEKEYRLGERLQLCGTVFLSVGP